MRRAGDFGSCDSNWAGELIDGKSTSSYVFTKAGAAVRWCSRKQTIIATSTFEAEFLALSMAWKEAIWIRRLISIMAEREHVDAGMKHLSDSQSVLTLAAKESDRRNKHIDITSCLGRWEYFVQSSPTRLPTNLWARGSIHFTPEFKSAADSTQIDIPAKFEAKDNYPPAGIEPTPSILRTGCSNTDLFFGNRLPITLHSFD